MTREEREAAELAGLRETWTELALAFRFLDDTGEALDAREIRDLLAVISARSQSLHAATRLPSWRRIDWRDVVGNRKEPS